MLAGGADEGFWLGRHTVSSTAQISCAQELKLAQTFRCLGTSVEVWQTDMHGGCKCHLCHRPCTIYVMRASKAVCAAPLRCLH